MAKPTPSDHPTIRVKPHSYQPSKAEREAPIRHQRHTATDCPRRRHTCSHR